MLVKYNGCYASIKGISRDDIQEHSRVFGDIQLDPVIYTAHSSMEGGFLASGQEEEWTTLTGLLPSLLKGKQYILEDDCDNVSSWDLDSIKIDPRLRPSQVEAVTTSLRKKRGIVKMVTGSGKTWCAAELSRIYLEKDLRVIISVSTRSLLYQMKEDLIEYGINEVLIGLVGDGNKQTSRPLVIGINDSLAIDKNYAQGYPGYLNDRDLWIADECHTLANGSGFAISHNLPYTCHRIGFSATPWSNTGMNNLLTGIFGPIIYQYNEIEAIEDGVIMKPQVLMYRSPKTWAPKPLMNRKYSHYVYNLLYKHLILNNEKRNKLIADLAANYMDKQEAPLAIIVSKVNTKPNHPEKILPYLKDRGYDLPVISGKTGKKIFQKTLDDLRSFSIPGAIFGPGVMKEGVNIKGLGCIALAGAGSSDLALIQRVGRALRIDEGKARPLIIDFYDQQSFFLGQASKRMATYVDKYGASNVEIKELSD